MNQDLRYPIGQTTYMIQSNQQKSKYEKAIRNNPNYEDKYTDTSKFDFSKHCYNTFSFFTIFASLFYTPFNAKDMWSYLYVKDISNIKIIS